MDVFKQGNDFMRDEALFSVLGCRRVLDVNSRTTLFNPDAIDTWSSIICHGGSSVCGITCGSIIDLSLLEAHSAPPRHHPHPAGTPKRYQDIVTCPLGTTLSILPALLPPTLPVSAVPEVSSLEKISQ